MTARIAAAKLTMLVKRLQRMGEDEQASELARALTRLQLALERVSVRLETLAVTGLVSAEELSVVREVVRALSTEYSTVIPGIMSSLQEIERAVAEAAAAAGVELEPPGSGRVGEAARRILEEAERAAEERLRSLEAPPGGGRGS